MCDLCWVSMVPPRRNPRRDVMMKLKGGASRIAGVAVVKPNSNPVLGFSPHTTCPNENTGGLRQHGISVHTAAHIYCSLQWVDMLGTLRVWIWTWYASCLMPRLNDLSHELLNILRCKQFDPGFFCLPKLISQNDLQVLHVKGNPD